MLPNVLATGSQKYDALMSMIVPAGDANLDGIVDYADFQTLAANYGATNDYWEQGDFNDDGAVNWQDLNHPAAEPRSRRVHAQPVRPASPLRRAQHRRLPRRRSNTTAMA